MMWIMCGLIAATEETIPTKYIRDIMTTREENALSRRYPLGECWDLLLQSVKVQVGVPFTVLRHAAGTR